MKNLSDKTTNWFIKLYDKIRIINSKTYISSLEIDQLKKELKHGFNLNPQRSIKTFLKFENSEYEGTLSKNNFLIQANNAQSSSNKGGYFFFTQVSGKLIDKGDKREINITIEMSNSIVVFIGMSFIMLFLFSIANILYGIYPLIFALTLFFYGRKNIKSDFEIFEIHLYQIVTNLVEDNS